MINEQATLFLIFSFNGVIIGLLFDFFRILRKSFKTPNLITYIQDILFWIFTGISIVYFLYNYSDGNIRFFLFIALILGFLLYILTISKYIICIFVNIIIFCKKILIHIFIITIIPIKSLSLFIKYTIKNFLYVFLLKISHFNTKYTNKTKINNKNVKK